MKLRYLLAARQELKESIAWYRERSFLVALNFNQEVKIAERLLMQHPRIGKRVEDTDEIRSLCINDFPYTLFYAIERRELVVVALAHHNRCPGYWMGRF